MVPQDDLPTGSQRGVWVTTLAAAAILMVTMGARQSLGLFISPLKSSTGLGITTISLANGSTGRATAVALQRSAL